MSKEVTGPNATVKHSLLPDRQMESPPKRPKSAEGKTSANDQVCEVLKGNSQLRYKMSPVLFLSVPHLVFADLYTVFTLLKKIHLGYGAYLCTYSKWLFKFHILVGLCHWIYRKLIATEAGLSS